MYPSNLFIIFSLFLVFVDAFEFWHRDTISSLFPVRKRAVSAHRQQCILVAPPPLFNIPSSNPGTASGDGDQSPLLPSPSRGEAGTIRAQSACGDIGASGMWIRFKRFVPNNGLLPFQKL